MLAMLLALLLAVIAAYFSLNTDDALAVFFAIVAGISLVASFVFAPWFVKLLILVGALGAFRYYCRRHACENANPLASRNS